MALAGGLREKHKKHDTEEGTLAAAVCLDHRGRTLLLPPSGLSTRRAAKNEIAPLVSKMWHFPMVRVRECAAAELQSFLAELIPAVANHGVPLEPLSEARHAVTYRKIELLPFLATVAA